MNEDNIGETREDLEQVEELQGAKEQRSRTGMIVALIVGVALLVACSFGVLAIVGGIAKFGDSIDEIIHEEEELEQIKEESTATKSDKRYIGDETFGYLEVKGVWSNYEDGENNKVLQYSNGLYLITLFAVPTLQADAETYAARVLESFTETDEEEEEAEETEAVTAPEIAQKVTALGDYDAYQLSYYDAEVNIYHVMWFFEAEDNRTHYIEVEGPDPSSDKFAIPESFTLKKED